MSTREKLLQKFGTRWKEIELEGEKVLVKLITLKEAKEMEALERGGKGDWLFTHISEAFIDTTDHKPIFSVEFLKGEGGEAISGLKFKELSNLFWEHNGAPASKN